MNEWMFVCLLVYLSDQPVVVAVVSEQRTGGSGLRRLRGGRGARTCRHGAVERVTSVGRAVSTDLTPAVCRRQRRT